SARKTRRRNKRRPCKIRARFLSATRGVRHLWKTRARMTKARARTTQASPDSSAGNRARGASRSRRRRAMAKRREFSIFDFRFSIPVLRVQSNLQEDSPIENHEWKIENPVTHAARAGLASQLFGGADRARRAG